MSYLIENAHLMGGRQSECDSDERFRQTRKTLREPLKQPPSPHHFSDEAGYGRAVKMFGFPFIGPAYFLGLSSRVSGLTFNHSLDEVINSKSKAELLWSMYESPYPNRLFGVNSMYGRELCSPLFAKFHSDFQQKICHIGWLPALLVNLLPKYIHCALSDVRPVVLSVSYRRMVVDFVIDRNEARNQAAWLHEDLARKIVSKPYFPEKESLENQEVTDYHSAINESDEGQEPPAPMRINSRRVSPIKGPKRTLTILD